MLVKCAQKRPAPGGGAYILPFVSNVNFGNIGRIGLYSRVPSVDKNIVAIFSDYFGAFFLPHLVSCHETGKKRSLLR